MNRIRHFEAKHGKRFDKSTTETLFQFSEEYFEEEDDDLDGSESNSDDDEKNSNDDTAEIQHILTANIDTHSQTSNDIMDF